MSKSLVASMFAKRLAKPGSTLGVPLDSIDRGRSALECGVAWKLMHLGDPEA